MPDVQDMVRSPIEDRPGRTRIRYVKYRELCSNHVNASAVCRSDYNVICRDGMLISIRNAVNDIAINNINRSASKASYKILLTLSNNGPSPNVHLALGA
uniref:ZP domain-containing protein n=1 Tax=Strongyloides stercoralis TaxID=6248 RepID=A0A0K0EF49_STRER